MTTRTIPECPMFHTERRTALGITLERHMTPGARSLTAGDFVAVWLRQRGLYRWSDCGLPTLIPSACWSVPRPCRGIEEVVLDDDGQEYPAYLTDEQERILDSDWAEVEALEAMSAAVRQAMRQYGEALRVHLTRVAEIELRHQATS